MILLVTYQMCSLGERTWNCWCFLLQTHLVQTTITFMCTISFLSRYRHTWDILAQSTCLSAADINKRKKKGKYNRSGCTPKLNPKIPASSFSAPSYNRLGSSLFICIRVISIDLVIIPRTHCHPPLAAPKQPFPRISQRTGPLLLPIYIDLVRRRA